jgi:hypothetical protein
VSLGIVTPPPLPAPPAEDRPVGFAAVSPKTIVVAPVYRPKEH